MLRTRNPNASSRSTRSRAIAATAVGLLAILSAACSGAATSGSARSPAAEKWFQRAQNDFEVAEIDEARDAVRKALSIAPDDPQVRLLAGRIALSRLEFDETLRLLKGSTGSEAAGLRGRAYWYKGDLDRAADELESMLDDPEVVDEWAKAMSKLARRGAGRTPFAMSGALLASVEMVHVSPVAPYFVVEVEIDGERGLAMVSTGTAEVFVDSSTRPDPSWVSLRFDRRLEIADVPAIPKDLSGVSKEMGVPIRATLGANLLRQLNATIDYGGRQFVVRTYSPPPPPYATRVPLYYARGGGMLMPSTVGADGEKVALYVDSSSRFPIALDQAGWQKAGFSVEDLQLVPEDPTKRLRTGIVPTLRLGAYDVTRVPGVLGAPIKDLEEGLRFNIDGIIGNGLLARYRLTLADGGRLLWLEDDTAVEAVLNKTKGMSPMAPPYGDPSMGAPGMMPPGMGAPGMGPALGPMGPGMGPMGPGMGPMGPGPIVPPPGGPSPTNESGN